MKSSVISLKTILIWIAFAFAFASCSPQKRINRIVKNHPELIFHDTIHFKDSVTITTQRVKTDTLLLMSSMTHDTTIITKENLTIKTIYNTHTDSLYIFGQCDTITKTAYIERMIPVEKVKVVEGQSSKFLWGVITALGIVMLFMFGMMVFKR